jgi:colicin import membrane protein
MQHSRFAAEDRLAFAPPPQPGLMRAFALAVLAHLLLLLALMNGLKWQRETQDAAVEAELWAAVPQQAAPREVVPPPPPPQPVVKAPPQPEPPVVKAPPQPDPQELREAQIAVEREKHKRELEKKHQAELEREREQRRKDLAAKKREEELAQKKREEDLAKKKELQKQQLAEARQKEEEKKRKQQELEARDAKRREQLRKEQIERSLAMAGTGAPSATGTAARSSGPSASWGARVQARVRPNIVFSDDVSGNPEAVIEVRLAPDGTIVGKRLKKSSGNRSWDEAVLRALDKTETLPRDVDGRVPSGGDLVFRPKG